MTISGKTQEDSRHLFVKPAYWDTYWTVKGLLISQMQRTVEGMLINFSQLITKFGMIPNGNRIYYTARSQPPLFIPMVWEYFQVIW